MPTPPVDQQHPRKDQRKVFDSRSQPVCYIDASVGVYQPQFLTKINTGGYPIDRLGMLTQRSSNYMTLTCKNVNMLTDRDKALPGLTGRNRVFGSQPIKGTSHGDSSRSLGYSDIHPTHYKILDPPNAYTGFRR